MAGTQMTVVLRRTETGGWAMGGGIGEPGAAHAQAVTASFQDVDRAEAVFLAGLAAGLLGLDYATLEAFAAKREAA